MLGQRRAYSDLFYKYLLFTGAEGNKSYSEKWIINKFMSLRKKLISCILIGEIGALSFLCLHIFIAVFTSLIFSLDFTVSKPNQAAAPYLIKL